MSNEQEVLLEDGPEADGPDFFADGHDHEAQSGRERTSHWTPAKLGHASMAQAERLHLQCRGKQGWNILDEDFPCDVQATKCSALDEVSRVVGATRIDGENFVVADIHARSKKVQKHVPGTTEPLLVDAGEESSEVLVVHLEMTMFRSLPKDRQEVIDITSGETIRTSDWNELKDHASQDIERGPEWCIHEGDDGPATLVVLLFLGQNFARWKLTALTNSPWIGLGVLTVQLGDKCRSNGIRSFMHLAKNIRIQKGAFDCLVVEARAEDSQGRGMFVLTMEDRVLKKLFEVLDGRACNVIGEM